jgi:acyl-CoA thioesterase I
MQLFSSFARTGINMVVLMLGLNLIGQSASADTRSPPCKIAVLGDSLTAGYGVAAGEAFPVLLAGELAEAGFACEVVDAGVSGDTSAGGRARLDWVLADEPSHLIVELGGNDGLRGLPVEQLESNLAAIIEKARAGQVQVFLAGMLAPPNFGRDYTDAFKAVYTDLAARYDLPLYPFFLDGVITDKSLMQPDGIHPNAAGVVRLAAAILPSISAWLEATGVVASR